MLICHQLIPFGGYNHEFEDETLPSFSLLSSSFQSNSLLFNSSNIPQTITVRYKWTTAVLK